MSRVVSWFSAGAPSAVTTKLTLAEYGHDNVVVAFIDTGSEHQDSKRFIADCERWFDHPVTVLKSEKYSDTWDVWERRKFLIGPHGAACTGLLKKQVRYAFQRPDDIQPFGYTTESREQTRAARFRLENPEVDLRTPLIDRGLYKPDCKALVQDAGIRLPWLYEIGFGNANCMPCVKGGMGYWNKVRIEFPVEFWRMAALERRLGHAILREPKSGAPLYLDELNPKRGDFASEPDISCSVLCSLASDELSGGA